MASFNSVTYGVRKVGDLLTKLGRSLIVTEKDDSKIEFDDIPDGALRVNPETGDIHVKLTGYKKWWSPKWAKDYFDFIAEVPANGDYEYPVPDILSYELTVENIDGKDLKDKFIDSSGILDHTRESGVIKIHNHYNKNINVKIRCYKYDILTNLTTKFEGLLSEFKDTFNQKLEEFKFSLTPECIKEEFLAENSVTSDKIKNYSVTKFKVAPKSIGANELEDNAIDGTKLVRNINFLGEYVRVNGKELPTTEYVESALVSKYNTTGGEISGPVIAKEITATKKFIGALEGNATSSTVSENSKNAQRLEGKTLNEILESINTLIDKASKVAPKVSVMTGVVNGGETIPLPDGYTEDQCKWIVSVRTKQVDDDNTITCYTDEHRVVTCWTRQRGNSGTVNYLIIGMK